MTLIELTTKFGGPPAPAPGHSAEHCVIFHMPLWSNLLQFVDKKPELFAQLKTLYPRFKPLPAIQELSNQITVKSGIQGKTCLLFSDKEAAIECKKFACSHRLKENACSEEDIIVKCYQLKDRIYAVFFPLEKFMMAALPFWQHAGPDLSAREATANLPFIEKLQEISLNSGVQTKKGQDAVFSQLRERIVSLLERQIVGAPRTAVTPDDVYLFQTGMASLWYMHQWLPQWREGTAIQLGYAFHSTIHLFEPEYTDRPSKFFPLGNDLDELENFVGAETKQGRAIQAVYCEFPSNPMLTSPDLKRLREMADKYDFLLVVDDTLSSFANVDVLGEDGADILWTSLTKSFNGYSDVMAASVVINPCRKYYKDLKALFSKVYHNDLYVDDALILESNSRDYLERSTILNKNALALASMLQQCAESPSSTVSKVFYPPFLSTSANYEARKRPANSDFTPGYGCLFSFEFDTDEAIMAFYDVIGKYIHIGPHLGAHVTLLMPYVKGLYGKELDKVAPGGLNPRQLRISAGLENTETLLAGFKKGLEAADATRN